MCTRDRNVYKVYLCGWNQSLLQIPEKVTPDSVTGINIVCVTGSSGLCPRDEWVSQAAHAGQKPQANVIASNVPD